MARSEAIGIAGVSKRFADFQALDDVSFSIRENEFFTLLGPSGCGKTTLLRMIAGFERPTSGAIRLFGQPLDALPPHRRRVNTVFQSYALFPHMTVAQNVAFGLENLGWDRARREARVARMLDMVHMTEFAARKPVQLSGGQRQRIALARALAPEPQVLLLDEPLSALDLKLRQAMRDELRTLQRETGITFVFVTHDQEEPVNRFVADFIGETNFLDGEVIAARDGKVRVRTPFGAEILAAATGVTGRGVVTLSLRPEKIGLEDEAAGTLLAGIVVSRNYMGGYTHYTIDAGGVMLRVSRRNAASHGEEGFAIGRTVRVGFRPESVRVLGA
jgi:spermidine/putrescine transport system ATP-binding protein